MLLLLLIFCFSFVCCFESVSLCSAHVSLFVHFYWVDLHLAAGFFFFSTFWTLLALLVFFFSFGWLLYLLSLHIFWNPFFFCCGYLCLLLTLLITVAWTTTHKSYQWWGKFHVVQTESKEKAHKLYFSFPFKCVSQLNELNRIRNIFWVHCYCLFIFFCLSQMHNCIIHVY